MNHQLEIALEQVQKPARYTGGELNSVIKDLATVDTRFAFCFPDIYEVGMSHLGMKILYGILNEMPGVWCERVFAPWPDFETQMRERHIPLYGLESGDSVKAFDFIGFSLMYEMSYTGVLNMLDLAGLPLRASERGEHDPIVICGGPCTCNPEPMAPFVELFCIGEGEEVLCEVVELYRKYKRENRSRKEFLLAAASVPGIYVPSLYDVCYRPDRTIASVKPKTPSVPEKVKKRVVKDLDQVYYPKNFILPYIQIVHDRAVVELFRGCGRSCRFCQAGFIYRPLRKKHSDVVDRQARNLCESTGYDEVSLSSLSTSDYSELEPLLSGMLGWTEPEKTNISLPSLRIDNISQELLEKIRSVRKSSLTFAAEAGTQRMRDVINKNISEEEILNTCRLAFAGGWTSVKLYFMLGLPTETMKDIEGIALLAQKIVDLYYHMPSKPKGKAVNVAVSVSTFVPKPFTPFQWEPQDTMEMIDEKQKRLVSCIRSRKITLSTHGAEKSFLEAVFARGDRRLADVLEAAYREGCRLDSWDDFFDFGKWEKAFRLTGIDPSFYADRRRKYDEVMPWDHLDYGISKEYLARESRRAGESRVTKSCYEACQGCGADSLEGGCPVCRK